MKEIVKYIERRRISVSAAINKKQPLTPAIKDLSDDMLNIMKKKVDIHVNDQDSDFIQLTADTLVVLTIDEVNELLEMINDERNYIVDKLIPDNIESE